MSEKAILYATDELHTGEIREFTDHLHHCRFCVDLILDLRMAVEESRESADQPIEVLPALADAVLKSSRKEPAQRLIEDTGDMISRVRSFLFLPKLLVPLATACLIFIVVHSGLKHTDSVRQHEMLRTRVETSKQNNVPPAKSPPLKPDNGVSSNSVASEKQDQSSPQETLYSTAPVLKPAAVKNRKKRMLLSPLERLDLGQLKLVGIVRSQDGKKAIVEEHSGKGHVLEVGTYIGKNKGRVIRIEKDSVVVAEEITDETGKLKTKEMVLKLNLK